MDYRIPNFKHLTAEEGKVYGGHNTVTSVNPYKCYFIATYPDGSIVKGNNLFNTGWDDIPQGLSKLSYVLSTGHLIEIPRYRAYKPLIECSLGMDGSRIFHSIRVQCLDSTSVVIDKIMLQQDQITKYKIGDRIWSREPIPAGIKEDKSWKYTS